MNSDEIKAVTASKLPSFNHVIWDSQHSKLLQIENKSNWSICLTQSLLEKNGILFALIDSNSYTIPKAPTAPKNQFYCHNVNSLVCF